MNIVVKIVFLVKIIFLVCKWGIICMEVKCFWKVIYVFVIDVVCID